MNSEKRRVERTRTDQLLYVELGTGNGGIVLDVSEEGCGFLSIAPIWDKEPHFAFAIGGGRQIQGEGKVVWVDGSKKIGGLRFVNASPAFREQVRAWLAEPKLDVLRAEPKLKPQLDIFKRTEAQVDSPAKQRRRQLREEARARSEAAERAARASEFGEAPREAPESGRGKPDRGSVDEQIFLHGPSERHWPAFLTNRRVWKGVAGFAFGAAVAALGAAYHQEAGAALMRLGTSLAGKQGQVMSASESGTGQSAPAPLQTQPASAVKPLVNDAVEHKSEPVNNTRNGEPAMIEQVAASPGPKAPLQNAPASPGTNVASNALAVQKLATKTEESTPKQGGWGTRQSPAIEQKTTSEVQQTNAAALKPTPPTQAVEPKKKEPHHATAEQVQALWSEVEGGDVSAEVALGELYARGNGVPKSCGQARMLLNSAAKKGSDEARQKLEQLGDEGCP